MFPWGLQLQDAFDGTGQSREQDSHLVTRKGEASERAVRRKSKKRR